MGEYLTLVSSKKKYDFFFYCKEIKTIKIICNAGSYLSAIHFVSYSTVSNGYSKEKYWGILPLLWSAITLERVNDMVFHPTVMWCHLVANI